MRGTIRVAFGLLIFFYAIILFRHSFHSPPSREKYDAAAQHAKRSVAHNRTAREVQQKWPSAADDDRPPLSSGLVAYHPGPPPPALRRDNGGGYDDGVYAEEDRGSMGGVMLEEPVGEDGMMLAETTTTTTTTPSPQQRLELVLENIRHISHEDKLDEVRTELEDLKERLKSRERRRREYEFEDDKEEHRDKEREWIRELWKAQELQFARWNAGVKSPRGGSRSSKVVPGIDSQTIDSDDPENCPGMTSNHPFVPYTSYKRSTYQSDYAYVTYVSSPEFVQAAATLMYSVAVSGSQYSRAICVTTDVSQRDLEKLSMLGQVVVVEKIASPRFIETKRYRDTFTKLRMWQLVMFTKVVYIDTDVIVLRNMDDLFDLPEWSVPMDAEQDRYSTGMMVLEPSLTTFKAMMDSLQTSTTSMELPDLLFLKDFFEGRKSQTRIGLIPRWYQVYQEEFGSEYSTYLTQRKQRITIFDERIHGLHFPGAGKPWIDYRQKYTKYRGHFCDWQTATDFQYEPQFLWYVYFAQMKRSLASTAGETLFDYEAGPQIVLTRFVEQKEKEIAEEKSRWSSWQYRGDNQRNSYYSSDDRGWRRPPRWQQEPRNDIPVQQQQEGAQGAAVVQPDEGGIEWSPTRCRALVPIPDYTNKTTNWDSTIVGAIDFSAVAPFVYRRTRSSYRRVAKRETWIVSWCTLSNIVVDEVECPAAAQVSYHRGKECSAAFNEVFSLHALYNSKALTRDKKGCIMNHDACGKIVSGVVFRARTSASDDGSFSWVEVAVRCDRSLPENTVEIENITNVIGRDELEPSSDVLYKLRLRSRCACINGCGTPAGLVSTLPPVQYTAWRQTIGSYSYAHRCAAQKKFEDCWTTMPTCAFNEVHKMCVPPSTMQWVLYSPADAQRFVSGNCTFVGGTDNAPLQEQTIESCTARALDSRANIVNYRDGSSGGLPWACYYKYCPHDALLKLRIPLQRDVGGGWAVYMLNPFFNEDSLNSKTQQRKGAGGLAGGDFY